MIVYRLSKSAYKEDLSGTGAKLYGGRWNSVGIPMLYTAENRSLCAIEIAVHLPLGILPPDYFLTTIYIPDSSTVAIINETMLPMDWRLLSNGHLSRAIGDNFVKEGQNLAIKVPSAAVKGDFNWLLNPAHPEFSEVGILENEPFPFDSRLFIR